MQIVLRPSPDILHANTSIIIYRGLWSAQRSQDEKSVQAYGEQCHGNRSPLAPRPHYDSKQSYLFSLFGFRPVGLIGSGKPEKCFDHYTLRLRNNWNYRFRLGWKGGS